MQRDSSPLPGELQIPMFRPDGEVYSYFGETTPARVRTIWQYWQNTKSRRALERAGYTQESIDFIETNILTPEDHAFIAETSRVTAEIYELVKPVYERLTNKPLGYEAFYLPLLSDSEIDASGDILPGASNMENMLKGGTIWGDPNFVAPASTKAASDKSASSPAPCSTTTAKPSLTSLVTASGTVATRFSPGNTSRGTPMRWGVGALSPVCMSVSSLNPEKNG
jgi:hypothetical protein